MRAISFSRMPCNWTQFKIQITTHQCNTWEQKHKVQNIIMNTTTKINWALKASIEMSLSRFSESCSLFQQHGAYKLKASVQDWRTIQTDVRVETANVYGFKLCFETLSICKTHPPFDFSFFWKHWLCIWILNLLEFNSIYPSFWNQLQQFPFKKVLLYSVFHLDQLPREFKKNTQHKCSL